MDPVSINSVAASLTPLLAVFHKAARDIVPFEPKPFRLLSAKGFAAVIRADFDRELRLRSDDPLIAFENQI
jgi:hypothetical protein